MLADTAAAKLSTAIIAAYGIQWLKSLKTVPFINYEAQNLNRALSILVATLSGAGIYFTFDHQAGTLMITGLTAVNAFHFVSHALQQFAMQHVTYKAAIAPPLPGVTQDQIRKNGHGDPPANAAQQPPAAPNPAPK